MPQLKPSKEPSTYLPQLSLAERDRRWNATRAQMLMRGLDCLLVWSNDLFFGCGLANFRYLTHCAAFGMGGYAVFPLDGDPTILLGTPDMNQPHHACVGTQNWINTIRPVPKMPALVDLLKEMGFERARIGVVGFGSALVSDSYGYHSYSQLLSGLPLARISDQTSLLDEMRLIKSAEEIQMLEKSAALAKRSVEALIDGAHVGARECELWADMMRAQVAHGGEPHTFNWISSGSVADNSTLKRLLHGNPPPAAPTMRPLQEGDLVVNEFHASYGGYLSAVELSLFVGEAPKELVDLHSIAVESLRGALEKFRPGVTLGEVVRAMRKPVEDAHYDYIEVGFHGHGLASPEFPTIVHKPHTATGLYGKAYETALENMELRPGMVFGTNIDIHNPKWKTDKGIMLGDTILVTESAPKRLVGIRLDLPCVR